MSTVDLDRFFKGGDNNMKRQKSGFTLVELLIVIALLGALAIGLIGALDPFEQLKKGTDTGTRDLVNKSRPQCFGITQRQIGFHGQTGKLKILDQFNYLTRP